MAIRQIVVSLADRPARDLNLFVKICLVGLLLYGLSFPNLPQISDKGWAWRAAVFPLAIVAIPVVWRAKAFQSEYPHLADALLGIPFLFDIAGNLFNLYDTQQYFDETLHFLNGAIGVAALVVLLSPLKLAAWNKLLLGVGFGAIASVGFEGLEYLISESGASGLNLTYFDTISDLVLSTVGGALGAGLVVAYGESSDDFR